MDKRFSVGLFGRRFVWTVWCSLQRCGGGRRFVGMTRPGFVSVAVILFGRRLALATWARAPRCYTRRTAALLVLAMLASPATAQEINPTAEALGASLVGAIGGAALVSTTDGLAVAAGASLLGAGLYYVPAYWLAWHARERAELRQRVAECAAHADFERRVRCRRKVRGGPTRFVPYHPDVRAMHDRRTLRGW